MKLHLGVAYDLPPIAPVAAHTRLFPAGSLTFGVEYRELDESTVEQTFTAEQRAASEIESVKPGAAMEDRGVSIHVFAAGGDEYLRFDCFDEEPHYHYIVPGTSNVAIAFDRAANGDMLAWALDRLRTRLPLMLAEAGAVELADRVDGAAVAGALQLVEQEARKAVAVGRAA